jgi:septal ring factor EnvC (AmiA/AmiB activator)
MPATQANDTRLEQLRKQIQTLRNELDSDRQQQQGLLAQLRHTEKRIGKATALLRALQRQLRHQQHERGKLDQRRQGLQADLQQQRLRLAQQIRATYIIGQQEYLKILLNQQDPAAFNRALTYYDYFHRARLERIQDIDTRLTDLHALEQQIRLKTERLEQTRHEQDAEKDRLEQTRSQRTEVLAKLDRRIRGKGERLTLLQEDARRLQRLLDRLARPTTMPPAPLTSEQGEHKPFARRRGQLDWPSHGRLVNRYGSTRKVGKLKWQGVLIQAPEGTSVHAISHGRVAFSDWLRGFGLLTIIDHGDGYMSLYGSNQSLYKEVGDWVDEGEAIASVGDSGGRRETALYFEIRHNGKPVNPLKWCRNQPKKI